MKRCENCKTTFSDSVNFCTECGQTLVYVSDSSQYESGDNHQTPKRKKKRSIWKILLITLLVLVIGFIALVNYVMNAATYLRVEPNMLVADKNGGETVVDIDYDGYVWVINHIPDWIEVEEYEESFSVKAESNLTGHNREGSITVQSGDFLAQVVIQQKGQATYIKASKTSLHFDEDGGKETITIDTDYKNSNLIVKIKDSGCGIKEPEKIFFAGYTTKGVGVGTGLGLAISQKIIEKHNGKIEVNSQINNGSEFIITIPS